MPVAKVLERDFIDYVSKPISDLINDSGGINHAFNSRLRGIYFKIIGESRSDIVLNSTKDLLHIITEHNDAKMKLRFLEKSLFESSSDGIYYKSTYPPQKIQESGKLPQMFAYLIHCYCKEIEKTLDERIAEIGAINKENSSQNIDITILPTKKKRKPNRQSFQLIHSDVNLNLVHKTLRDEGFIDKGTSYDQFQQVFNGEPVSQKVIWGRANSLHCFIEEIITGGGVKNPNEGKWERAIKCFRKADSEYKIEDLQNTKPPVGERRIILKKAIDVINRR